MVNNDLHVKILGAKNYLNAELVKIKTDNEYKSLGYREINDRLDMIHEVERIGYRNLNEREMRKINRMLEILDEFKATQN